LLTQGSTVPDIWQVHVQKDKKISLKAVSVIGCCPPKLGYSSRCSSTTVKFNSGVDLNTAWNAVAINRTADLYEITPVQRSKCKSVSYVLGLKPKSGVGSSSFSSCAQSVSLVQNGFKKGATQGSTVYKMIWKFTRVKSSPLPPPKRPSPPPAVLQETKVVSTTFVTLPIGQACSSLSQVVLQNITNILCTQQMAYTLGKGWSQNQTACAGTARCPGARASLRQNNTNGTSEHTTDLTLIHTPAQNQTAEGVANDVSQAMNQTQTFYQGSFPPGTGINLAGSPEVIPPGGQSSPNPSPSPSPTLSPSPSPTISPDFNTVPDNVFEVSPTPVPTPVPIIPNPTPIPAPILPPGPATSVTTVATGAGWSASWTLANPAAQSYKINCVPFAVPTRRKLLVLPPACASAGSLYGAVLGSIATTGSITGLASGTDYACYVISYADAAGSGSNFACSSPAVFVQTLPAVVTNLAGVAHTYTWDFLWTPPASGALSYKINCVTPVASACDTGANVNYGQLLDTSATGGSLTLNFDAQFMCYVISYAYADGTGSKACSSGFAAYFGG
jgi:hypothetical protein